MKRLFFIPLLLVSLLASYSQSSLGPNANIIGSNIFISKTGYFGGIVITNPAGTIVGNGSGLTGVVGTASNLIDATNETARVAAQTTNHVNALSVNGSNDVLRVGQLGTNYTLSVGANGTNHIALATNTLATALSNNLATITATVGSLTVTNQTNYGALNVNVGSGVSLRVNTNQLVVTGGNVGIGTNSPPNKLTVIGDYAHASFGEGQLSLRGSNDTRKVLAMGIDTTVNLGRMQVGSIGVQYYDMAIQPSGGNLGIGTTTPSQKLEVSGNVLITNSANAALTVQPTETNVLLNVGSPSVVATALSIRTNASVGIGTNLPQTKLHVADPTTANGDVAMRVSNDAQSWDWTVQGSSNDWFRVYDVGGAKYPITIAPGSSNDMVVVNGGQVGIGTNAPNALLHLYRNAPMTNEVLFRIGTSDDTNRFSVDEDGDVSADGQIAGVNLISGGYIQLAAASGISFANRSVLYSPNDMQLCLVGTSISSNFNRLVFGTNSITTNAVNRYASLSFSNALFNTTPIMSVTAQDGQAPCDFRVSGDAHVTNSLTVLRSVTATNFVYSTPRWVDALASGMALRVGGSSPVRTEVEAGTGIYGTGFDDNEDSDFSIQFPHVCAATNTAFPQFWYEPHVHISVPSASIGAGESNCTFVISYSIAAPGITFSNSVVTMTNTLTITHPFMHHMLEFGHVTNNALQGTISAVVQGNLKRLPSATGNIGGRVIVDSLDYHVPIHMVGSSQESSN